MNFRIYIAILCICLFSQTATAQQIYKWVDDKGKVHFSDKPVSNNSESITIKQQPSIYGGETATTSPRSTNPDLMDKTLDAYSDRRRLKQQKQAKQEAEEARKKQHQQKCDDAREYLARTEGQRIYDVNEQGEKIYLSDDEIDAERAKVQSEINKHCR